MVGIRTAQVQPVIS